MNTRLKRFSSSKRPKIGTLCRFVPDDGRTTFVHGIKLNEMCIVVGNSKYCTIVDFESQTGPYLVNPAFLCKAKDFDKDEEEDDWDALEDAE